MSQPPPPPAPSRGGLTRAEWTGIAMVVAAAVALGLFPSGARIAYEGGGTPETVSVLRHVMTFVFVGLLLGAGRRGAANGRQALALALAPPRRAWPGTLLLGLVLAVFAWAYFTAIRYVPVSLAVLLLYTYPAQVVLMTAVFGMERLTRARGLALGLAFAGVALAVGASPAAADWRGVGFGLLAGFGLALMTVLGSHMMARGQDGRALIFHMAVVAAVLTAIAVAAGPGFGWPQGATAWGGLLFAGAAAGLGLMLYFLALPLIGPVRASLWANLEPVFGTLGAILILGERPGPERFAGIALVLCAIGLLLAAERRRAR